MINIYSWRTEIQEDYDLSGVSIFEKDKNWEQLENILKEELDGVTMKAFMEFYNLFKVKSNRISTLSKPAKKFIISSDSLQASR